MFRILAVLLGVILCSPLPGKADFQNISPQPTAPQSTVRFLTLNVMENSLNPAYSRDTRFNSIVSLGSSMAAQGKPITGFLLQELSGGIQGNGTDPPTTDSGADFARKFAAAGFPQGYYTAPMAGWQTDNPPTTYFVWKVGILSPYTFQATQATKLDPPGENYTSRWTGYPQPPMEFAGRSNVVMAEFNIPGFGKTDVYSVHVYDPTTIAEKNTQIQNLMSFVNSLDAINHPRATIIGGDMNFALSSSTQGIYQLFLNNGFIDSYPAVNADPGNTFVGNPPDPLGPPNTDPARIDYLFVRGTNLQITSSEVVFDGVNGAFVSDHFGVLTEISAVPIPGSLLLLGLGLLAMAVLGGKLKHN
jgi:endonuclease/exonuclease/phosphatase family metal-dependent hydrolase